MNKMINIVICGCYGRTNSGDDAILYSIIKQLRSINKNIDITVLSSNPSQTSRDYNVNSVYTFNFLKINKVLRKCDLFISGGGTLLQNVTSTRSLLYYLYTIRQAKKYNNKVIMYGCGIGPINGKFIRKISSVILNKYVDNILLRDSLSYKELNDLNVNLDKVDVGIDPSLLLSDYIVDSEDIFIKFNLDLNKKYVGISLKKSDNRFINEIIRVIKYLYKKGMVPVFIPMDYNEDLKFLKEISKKIYFKYHIIDKNISFFEKYRLISKMNFVIGMRLHAIVFAYQSNIKLMGISYDQKVDAFCDYYGIKNLMSVNDFTFEKFIYMYNDLKLFKVDKNRIKELNKKNEKILNKYIK